MSVILSPSLLSANFANLEHDIKLVEEAGADWLHIDVMDGHFVPNITIGIPVVNSIRKITNLVLDVHLMIENPANFITPFAKAGADLITFHYEAVEDPAEVISLIHKAGLKAGISIKPNTEPESIYQYLNDVDLVLVMTVEPGFGGQSFIHECASKIPLIKEKAPEKLIIQVDGGINNVTSKICTSLGANSLVAGSYIFNAEDIDAACRSLLH